MGFTPDESERLSSWLHRRLDAHVNTLKQGRNLTVVLSAQAQSNLAAIAVAYLPDVLAYKCGRPGEVRLQRKVDCELCPPELNRTLVLSSADRAALTELADGADTKSSRRARALLHLSDGATSAQAGARVRADRNSVDTWRDRWHVHGLPSVTAPGRYWSELRCALCGRDAPGRLNHTMCTFCSRFEAETRSFLIAHFAESSEITMHQMAQRWVAGKLHRRIAMAQRAGWLLPLPGTNSKRRAWTAESKLWQPVGGEPLRDPCCCGKRE